MSYGRETLGFRVSGVTPLSRERMHAEAARIEQEFRSGKCRWDRSRSNCADFVVRILRAGGFDAQSMEGPAGIVTMPLDVFDRVRTEFEGDPYVRTELVAYRRLPGSQASYRFSRFPLSLDSRSGPWRMSFARCPDRIEKAAGGQLTDTWGTSGSFMMTDARLSASPR